FPQQNASWTDLSISGGVLYASLGTANGTTGVNGVFHSTNYFVANDSTQPPSWVSGTADLTAANNYPILPLMDSRLGNYPFGQPSTNDSGNTRISVSGSTITVLITRPIEVAPPILFQGQLSFTFLNLLQSTDGGVTWNAIAAPPNFTNHNEGFYATAIV